MSTPCRLELGVTEGVAGNGRRRCNGELPIPASGRHGMIQPSEYLPGRLRVGQTIGLDIKGHGQNPAPDVTPDGLWVNQVRRTNRHANTDVGGQVYVWHDRYLLNIRRTAKPLDGVADLTFKRRD